MKYKYMSDIGKITEKEIWACAYKEDPENGSMRLKCLPTKGILLRKNGYSVKFVPLKTDGTLRKSGDVCAGSRKYADTYEECKELYNELIQDYIDQLEHRIDEAKKEFI
ncbi:hypothetical protein DW886_16870 [Enterocloster aldenensis]|uniref:hypothetical protein n=1 Tax=Enterocloster aldenensis TaxID=358742 RepID=UPI000E526BC9|nr:hypothetical protein DW886_16870 [Enterocloster aldenensis]